MKKKFTRSDKMRGVSVEPACLGLSAGGRRTCRFREFSKRGIVALPLMLLISGIVLEMTIAATLVVFYMLKGSTGARNAAEALVAAQSGISDVAVRLARNMGFDGTYSLTFDAQRAAQVTVCNQGRKTTPCSASGGCVYTNPSDAGKAEVTAVGTVQGRNRCVRALYAVDGETGEVRLESSGEIAL